MNTIRCSECNKLLPESACYCSRCGVSTSSPGHRSSHARVRRGSQRERSLNAGDAKPTATLRFPQYKQDHVSKHQKNTTKFPTSSKLSTTPLWEDAEVLEDEPSDEWQEIRRSATWHKNVAPFPNRAIATPLPPRPARVRPPMWNIWRRIYYRIPPTVLVWISLLVFISLLFGGASGIVVTLGRSAKNTASRSTMLSLQATPSSVAVGGTIMLDGENFSPRGKIGLMRDISIPLLDTANTAFINSDSHGNFTDTIAITPDWEAGAHTINAEDASKHKVASFSIMVTGHATSLRPAHLFVSVDALDLGSGDQATNTDKAITLTNIGGSVISWQAACSQPGITFSPANGTIASNHTAQVIISIDRAKLNIGLYSTQVNIFSNGGDSTVSVKAIVTALLQDQRPILQLTPSVLSFTSVDGGPAPATQVITVGNAGSLPLQSHATTSVNWLSVSPQSTTIQPYDSQHVTVSVNSSLLLPGTYEGTIMISGLGVNDVVDSPQTIFVTATITPQCSLLVTPGQLSFTGMDQQSAPTPKTITIGASQGCGMQIAWHAISNASWLNIDAVNGAVSASPNVGVNLSGLAVGTYNSSIIFSSNAGTQTLPVSLLVKPACAFTITPNILNIAAIAGQTASTIQQQVVLQPRSACPNALNWITTVATTSGGNWLSASSSGNVAPASSGIITVNVTLANLKSNSYVGSITVTATDSANNQVIGTPQLVQVNLNVQSPCLLGPLPTSHEVFATTAGSDAPSQAFALSTTGSCSGTITIAPSITFISGTGWLSMVANTMAIVNGGSATFTINITSKKLAVGVYKATILLSASGAGANNSQSVDVTLNIGVPVAPVATATPTPTPTPTLLLSPVPTATVTK